MLTASVLEKLRIVRRIGALPFIVTQFCFDPKLVIAWERRMRALIGETQIHVGIPGPASLTNLVRYARICGIGESVRVLTRGADEALRLAT